MRSHLRFRRWHRQYSRLYRPRPCLQRCSLHNPITIYAVRVLAGRSPRKQWRGSLSCGLSISLPWSWCWCCPLCFRSPRRPPGRPSRPFRHRYPRRSTGCELCRPFRRAIARSSVQFSHQIRTIAPELSAMYGFPLYFFMTQTQTVCYHLCTVC